MSFAGPDRINPGVEARWIRTARTLDLMTEPTEVVLYTRPGCPFCTILRSDLRANGLAFREVDIWQDPDAAAAVRAVADGNETVPTVHVGDTWLVNPPVDAIIEASRRAA